MASAVKSRSLALLPSQQHVTLLTRPLPYLFLATLPSVQSQLERAFLSPEGQCSWASDLGLHFPLRAHFLESSPVPTILQLRGECLPLSSGPHVPWLQPGWVPTAAAIRFLILLSSTLHFYSFLSLQLPRH